MTNPAMRGLLPLSRARHERLRSRSSDEDEASEVPPDGPIEIVRFEDEKPLELRAVSVTLYMRRPIPGGLVGGIITVNVVSNTLTTHGDIVNSNTRVVKNGNGTWEITGAATGAESLGLLVSAGQVNLHKTSGQAIAGGNSVGLTVQANADR